MSNETYVTVRGYTGGDPTVFRNEQGGSTVVLRVGVTARVYNRSAQEFRDGTTAWYSVRCYVYLAENVVGSVSRGTPVIVRGKLVPRIWQDRDGNNRIDNTILADALGVELSTGTAKFTSVKNQKLPAVAGEPAGSASEDNVPEEIAGTPPEDEPIGEDSTAFEEPRAEYEEHEDPDYRYDPVGNLATVQ